MAYLEVLLPEFRKGAKIRQPNWDNGEYIYLGKNGIVYDERDKPFDFTNEELVCQWELYQEPIDWEYIIKNKCLCCFICSDDIKKFGLAEAYTPKDEVKMLNGGWYKNCRPVRKDELTFYEDRKDDVE